jgi:ATP phosphoribosyltransferase
VAATEESGLTTVEALRPGTRVATVFPRITAAFFAGRGQTVEIVPVSGAAEIAPHIGIADVIVDLVSTGSTLRVNGLREIATVLESSARLIAAPGLARTVLAAGRWRSWWLHWAACLRLAGKRYVMANVLGRGSRKSSVSCPGSMARRSSTS